MVQRPLGFALIENSIVEASDAALSRIQFVRELLDSRPSARGSRFLDHSTKFLTLALVVRERLDC